MKPNKTQPTDDLVEEFLAGIADPVRQADSRQLVDLMQTITAIEPVMWGSSIVGFGTHHYKYATGREGDIMKVGFSPRKQALTLYGVIYYDKNRELLDRLGPHTTGKGCLYIKSLADVDQTILKRMIKAAYQAY